MAIIRRKATGRLTSMFHSCPGLIIPASDSPMTDRGQVSLRVEATAVAPAVNKCVMLTHLEISASDGTKLFVLA